MLREREGLETHHMCYPLLQCLDSLTPALENKSITMQILSKSLLNSATINNSRPCIVWCAITTFAPPRSHDLDAAAQLIVCTCVHFTAALLEVDKVSLRNIVHNGSIF